MSGSNVLVTFDELQAMASRLHQDGGAIGQQLDSLLTGVQSMVESGWQGQASAAFHGLYANATTSWKQVETALLEMSELLRGIGTQYQEHERAIASTLAG